MSRLSYNELRSALERRVTAAPLTPAERELLLRDISLHVEAGGRQPSTFSSRLSRLWPAAAFVGVLGVVTAVALLMPRVPDPMADPQSPSIRPGASVTLEPATPSPDANVASFAQARAVLDQWEQAVKAAPEGAIAFTGFVSHGGGWQGPDADEQKSAFLSGLIEASVQLSTDVPPHGDVVWEDGSRATVPLVSTTEALEDLRRGLAGGGCPECRPLEVVGARLITRGAETSRGWANVPAWELIFAERDGPTVPVTQVAVRDRIEVLRTEDVQGFMGYALGTSTSTSLTVGFNGSPCGPESFTAEAVESELGVVVLVKPDPPPPPDATPRICPAVAVGRTAVVELDAPLGSRTVLDPVSGQPIPVYAERPEGGFPRP